MRVGHAKHLWKHDCQVFNWRSTVVSVEYTYVCTYSVPNVNGPFQNLKYYSEGIIHVKIEKVMSSQK